MNANNISLSFNSQVIYKNASFNISTNDKIGIIGVNGAGKTTLFNVILGKIELDEGKINITKNTSIGYLPQEVLIEDEQMTVFDYIYLGRPIKKLEREIESLYIKVANTTNTKEQEKLLKLISKKQTLLEYYDFYNAEDQLLELIENMHVQYELLDRKMIELSGGEKSKIAFTKLLYSKSEILLLDEPTNHLDVTTRDFVINFLKNYQGMVLTISHDINFLNKIINKILYIDKANSSIDVFVGNYDIFLKKINDIKNNTLKIIEKQEKEESKLRDFILQYSNSSGKRKRIAQSREKLLEKKMKDRIVLKKDNEVVKFELKPSNDGSKIPLKINNITFSYDNIKKIIKDLSFIINNKERFLIIGNNGVGKSTLLKLIVGELIPDTGNIWYANKTEYVYYAQEQEILDNSKNVYENVDSMQYSKNQIRSILGSFLFHGDDIYKNIKILSPGERARISLCKIMLKRANLLVLDEPTNHLDPITQESIALNLKNYNGTIILVSHNIDFIEKIGIDRILVLPTGKIMNYSKDIVQKYYINN